MLVAVYGTLKEGFENYELYLAGTKPVFRAVVEIPYALYANDEYPVAIPAEERHPITVEVFDVDEKKLAELDALEERYDYWRESIYLHELGELVGIYVHAAPAPPGFTRVESGDWRR